MTYDLIVHNGTIVTVNTSFEIIPNGLLCIKSGKLQRVEALSGSPRLPAAKETINATGGIIMPGMVNTHTHLPMTLFRGLADDLPLDVWLNQHIFPAENDHLNPDNVRFLVHHVVDETRVMSAGAPCWPALKCCFPEQPLVVMDIFLKTRWLKPCKPAVCEQYWPRA